MRLVKPSEPEGSDFIIKYSNPKIDGETTYGFEEKMGLSKRFCSKSDETTFETNDTTGFFQKFATKIRF